MIFIFDDKTEPTDIFADIPSEKPGGGPSGTTPLPVGASGVIMEGAPFGKKWVVIGVLALLLVGGGGWFAWSRFKAPAEEPAAAPQPVPEPEPQPEPQPAPQPEPEPAPPQPEPEPQPEPVQTDTDTDADGLSDAREVQAGTDAALVDTDADGLSDREEVDVYATDPLNPDTDNDTYKDGAEVSGGYDPKGPGKLLQLPQ